MGTGRSRVAVETEMSGTQRIDDHEDDIRLRGVGGPTREQDNDRGEQDNGAHERGCCGTMPIGASVVKSARTAISHSCVAFRCYPVFGSHFHRRTNLKGGVP